MSGIRVARAVNHVLMLGVVVSLFLGAIASTADAAVVQPTTTTVFTGRVVDEVGLALPGALVGVYALEDSNGANPQLRGYAVSDGAGYITVTAVGDPLSGRYYYQATAPGRDSNTWGYADSSNLGELRMYPRPDVLVGSVTRLETGEPVPLTIVDLRTESDSWGGRAFGGPEGSYNVGCDTQPAGAGTYSVIVTDYQIPATFTAARYEFYWEPGMDPVVHDFVVHGPSPVLEGAITDLDTGQPLEDAAVDGSILDTDTAEYIWGGTDWSAADGSYSLLDEAGLGAGEWKINCMANRYAKQTTSVTWNGADPLTRDFEMDMAPAAVTGLVTDKLSGQPVPGADIVLTWEMYEDNWVDTDSGVSAPNGTYSAWGTMPGHYNVRVDAWGYGQRNVEFDWNGSGTVTLNIQLSPVAEEVPVQGADRFTTAVEASKLAFPDPGTCDVAVVASGRNFPDALGGSSLAGAVDGPMLLTEPSSLPSAVAAEIGRLGCSRVMIVGGRSAVSDAVKNAIDALPGVSVERIEGANRYATAQKVAERTVNELGADYNGVVFLATGTNFPDALAAAPLAASNGMPILLVKKDDVPDETIAAFNSIQPGYVVVLGGEGAIDADVYAFFRSYFPDAIRRIAGANRYTTAAAVAQFGVDEFGLSWDNVAFATGMNFPDALAGGAAQGLTGSVVLLTKPTSLELEPRAKLVANANEISGVRFFGGSGAVSTSVRATVIDVINTSKH